MRRPFLLPTVLLLLPFALSGAAAQDVGGAFAGFGGNSDEPIQIESDRLEVNDVDKIATYSGNVHLRQGDTILDAPELVVHYNGDSATTDGNATTGGATTTAVSGSSTTSRVSRLEAGPGVIVHTATQTLTGDNIVFDMPNNLVTLDGNVVLTEGENIVRGDRLIVDLTTKIGHVEGGRVQTLIKPSGAKPSTQ